MRLLAAVLLLMPLSIVRRADVADARYLALGKKFPAVIAAGRAGDATLISDQWLITAAHVARSLRKAAVFTIGSEDYTADFVAMHPAWRDLGEHDVALIHLSRPVTGVIPIPLYRDSIEAGSTATLVGHGAAGIGESRDRPEDGERRGATSRVDSVSAAWLYFSFDAPPQGTELEGAPGRGDSGGPAIITSKGKQAVAGISSAGFDGRDGPGTYGAVDVFTRISTHLQWIDSVMSGQSSLVPLPSGRRRMTTAVGSNRYVGHVASQPRHN